MRPLHPAEHVPHPDDCWACSQPERPFDDDCVYEEHCGKWILKAQADLAAGAEDGSICDCDTDEPCTISGMIADYLAQNDVGKTT